VDADSGRELSRGEVVIVTYDYRQEKTIPIPPIWRDTFIEYEGLKV
jgi:acyl-CoA thioesterase FadM